MDYTRIGFCDYYQYIERFPAVDRRKDLEQTAETTKQAVVKRGHFCLTLKAYG